MVSGLLPVGCMSQNLCPYVLLMSTYLVLLLPLYMSLTKGFAPSLVDSTESTTWRKEWGHFIEIFKRVLQGIGPLLPTDSKHYYKHHCKQTFKYISTKLLTFMVNIYHNTHTNTHALLSGSEVWKSR